ncbi:Metallo-hydrolase/oxidoreductase [Coniochaeta hoffmannii]|uniref:Metallo-hydrolase/oxidoreductase n=1 Tax=Coniochaeta hoffmannii TaxID=91930 RepID=A0AA38SF55_9PEZI|nr:Metallo-hydrolase/oxidoreductase [Coniochaeta hoffmannii]
MALPPPDLKIPHSTATVEVSIIHTTATIAGLHAWKFMSPSIPGHDYLDVPCFCFLVHNPAQNRTVVFDLGIRKHWWNLSPKLTESFAKINMKLHVDKGVREILDEHGVNTSAIEAVIWSHPHFDHTGDPSTFDSSTALVVGPGFNESQLPGAAENPYTAVLESDYAGRELREVSFDGSAKIGRLSAMDYFGDGSFYLLASPGHTPDHMCGFARVTSNPDSFILMGGDAAHHCGEIRPSPYMPLPDSISPHPFTDSASEICPGAMFASLLPKGDKKPFYEPARLETGQAHYDVDETIRTMEKIQEADIAENVLVALAHDKSLLGVVDFFPKQANDFMKKGWNLQTRWRFLKDFATAVHWNGQVADYEAQGSGKSESQGVDDKP